MNEVLPNLAQTRRHHDALRSVFVDITRKLVTRQTQKCGVPSLEVAAQATRHLKKHSANKEERLHFTASESLPLEQRRRQVFSARHP